jgi:uncharacterized membrane protein
MRIKKGDGIMKDLLKKKGFWAAVAGLIGLVTQLTGLKIDAPAVNEIINGVCALLVVLGLMTAADAAAARKEIEKTDKEPDGKSSGDADAAKDKD